MTAINSNRAIRGPVTAVPVVAGKGVRLVADTVNNRWVVEADETVLWSGSAKTSSCELSESPSNFEQMKLTLSDLNDKETVVTIATTSATTWPANIPSYGPNAAGITFFWLSLSGTTLSVTKAKSMTTNFADNNASWSYSKDSNLKNTLTKVVGINRVASA